MLTSTQLTHSTRRLIGVCFQRGTWRMSASRRNVHWQRWPFVVKSSYLLRGRSLRMRRTSLICRLCIHGADCPQGTSVLHKGLNDRTDAALVLQLTAPDHLLQGVPDTCKGRNLIFHEMQFMQRQVVGQAACLWPV